MKITPEAVKERIAALSSAGELSIKEQFYLEALQALEKAQAKADVYDMLREDYGLREKGVGLADFVDWQAKRIAELESRTVKLPRLSDDCDRIGVHFKYAVALAAAGIKVEAE